MYELPMSEQTIEQPTHFQPRVEQPQTAEPKNSIFKSTLIFLLLLLVAMSGLWFYTTTRTEQSIEQQIEETPTVSPEITLYEESKPLFFVRDWQLWQSKNGVDTQLFTAGKAVLAFESSPDGKYLAYTIGDLQENSTGYQFVYPDTLFLLNTATGQQTELFSLNVTTNLEYVYCLVDLAFSRDGKHLAFSTSNNVFVHSFETNTTEPLFGQTNSTQVKNSSDILIFGYSGMSFSPTDEYLYVRRGFYEGMQPIVVSLRTKAEMRVPLADELGGYGGYILDWYDDHSLVAAKDLEAQPGQSASALLQLSILDQSFKSLASVPQEYLLYGAYQKGALRLFSVVLLSTGEDTNEIKWLTIDPQNPAVLTQLGSFKKQVGWAFETFEILDDDTVLFQTKDWSADTEQLYTFNKATNQLQLIKDDARLNNWK